MAAPGSVIETNNLVHGRMIAERAGVLFNLETDRVISVTRDGKLLGGVTYTGYTGVSIQIHVAGLEPNRANRDFLWMIFDYPFNQLGCRVVFGHVPEANTTALEISQKLGFKIVAKIEDVFPDGACYVLALAREDCRWLKIKPRGVVAGSET